MVLCSGSEKGDSANINFFDSLIDGDVDLGNGFLEWVKVADNKVDLVNALGLEVLFVRLDISSKNTCGANAMLVSQRSNQDLLVA